MTPTNESTGIELEKRILRGELQDIPNAARLFIYEKLSELDGTTKELELYKGLKRIITSQEGDFAKPIHHKIMYFVKDLYFSQLYVTNAIFLAEKLESNVGLVVGVLNEERSRLIGLSYNDEIGMLSMLERRGLPFLTPDAGSINDESLIYFHANLTLSPDANGYFALQKLYEIDSSE